jgi:mycothiol system anti-sigma-R factor
MNCRECVEQLNPYLDRELNEGEIRQVYVHLEHCPPCGKFFHFEAGVKRLVRRCCQAERAPDALRERLGQALREAQ